MLSFEWTFTGFTLTLLRQRPGSCSFNSFSLPLSLHLWIVIIFRMKGMNPNMLLVPKTHTIKKNISQVELCSVRSAFSLVTAILSCFWLGSYCKRICLTGWMKWIPFHHNWSCSRSSFWAVSGLQLSHTSGFSQFLVILLSNFMIKSVSGLASHSFHDHLLICDLFVCNSYEMFDLQVKRKKANLNLEVCFSET